MSLTRRLPLIAALVTLAVPAAAIAHEFFDHAPPSGGPATPPSPVFQAGGPNAKWEAVGTIATGNPHTDLDFFSRNGELFAAVGTLAMGANGGGVTFVRLVGKDGKVSPQFVRSHPSASCVSNPAAALALQHDIEVTPKPASAPLNTASSAAKLGDAQLIIDATDAEGRCHDQGVGGLAPAGAPKGGLEIIDISEGLANAREIGLTAHIGEAHTVNVDPKRPHIAYAVTSDSIAVDVEGKRANETAGTTTLDGFELVDLSSCMNFPAGTTVEAKRAACRPQVFRYRYPSAAFAQGHTADDSEGPVRGVYGCHELEVYPDDRLTCASGAVSIVFSMADAFDDNGTPADFTDDKPKGTPLPCRVRATSTAAPPLQTKAMITDCTTDGTNSLDVAGWTKLGSPSLAGVRHLGTAQHMGRTAAGSSASPKFDSTKDIDFSHEAEISHSGRYLIATDERGGGVLPPGAACDTPDANKIGNGGVHFYAMDRLRTTFTGNAEEAFASYAKTPKGDKAIYRVPIRTGAQATICTAHVFHQIPGQNRIFMSWYSQGTQVLDFVERADGTVELKEAGYFIPGNANEWVSAVYKVDRNADGTFTYWGAAADFNVSQGRNAIDLWKVTLPAPPAPRFDKAIEPAADGPAVIGNSAGSEACTAAIGLRNAKVKPRRSGALGLSFERAGGAAIDIDVFRVSRGSRVHGLERVARFRNRSEAFTWAARDMRNGAYIVRFRARGNKGGALAQRLALRRRGGRFRAIGAIERRSRCDEVTRLALVKPVFGGRTAAPLRVVARLTEAGAATVRLRRNGKTVRTAKNKVLEPNKTRRIALPSGALPKGRYTVRVELRFGHTIETLTLKAIRL